MPASRDSLGDLQSLRDHQRASIDRVGADIDGNAATHEQTAGLALVNQAMSQMDLVTQQNTALVEESTAATQSLESQAHQLARTVSVFQIGASQPALATPSRRSATRLRGIRGPAVA